MKITIDNKAKTITLEENTNLYELYKFLDCILKDSWKEYNIISNTTVIYSYPTYPTYQELWWGYPKTKPYWYYTTENNDITTYMTS